MFYVRVPNLRIASTFNVHHTYKLRDTKTGIPLLLFILKILICLNKYKRSTIAVPQDCIGIPYIKLKIGFIFPTLKKLLLLDNTLEYKTDDDLTGKSLYIFIFSTFLRSPFLRSYKSSIRASFHIYVFIYPYSFPFHGAINYYECECVRCVYMRISGVIPNDEYE